MIKLSQKRGLSDVITTVLIILLVLAAVAIIASFVLPTIRKGASQINNECLTGQLDIRPVSCKRVNDTLNNVTATWSNGQATLQEINFLFYDAGGESNVVTNKTSSPGEFKLLDTKVYYNLHTGLVNATKVSIRVKTSTEDGVGNLCPETVKIDCI